MKIVRGFELAEYPPPPPTPTPNENVEDLGSLGDFFKHGENIFMFYVHVWRLFLFGKV